MGMGVGSGNIDVQQDGVGMVEASKLKVEQCNMNSAVVENNNKQ
jgi:hypothetical protein